MAIVEVWIDEDACTTCKLCEETCPEVFEVDEVAVIKEDAMLSCGNGQEHVTSFQPYTSFEQKEQNQRRESPESKQSLSTGQKFEEE